MAMADGSQQTHAMKPMPPRRTRGGRRKGERRVVVLGNQDLFELLGCNDIDVLLVKLSAIGVQPHVCGWNEQRFVAVSDYQLPDELRQRAFEITDASSGWVGE